MAFEVEIQFEMFTAVLAEDVAGVGGARAKENAHEEIWRRERDGREYLRERDCGTHPWDGFCSRHLVSFYFYISSSLGWHRPKLSLGCLHVSLMASKRMVSKGRATTKDSDTNAEKMEVRSSGGGVVMCRST